MSGSRSDSTSCSKSDRRTTHAAPDRSLPSADALLKQPPEITTMRLTTHVLALSATLIAAAPVMAQANPNGTSPDTISRPAVAKSDTPAKPDSAAPATATAASLVPATVIQHIRKMDQRGINVFEAPKIDPTPFTGFSLSWGAAFTQQFQGLSHQNAASPKVDPITKVDANQLMSIDNDFN